MKRVIVTGATGFIARHSLQELVARKYEVHAVALRSDPPQMSGVQWHRADLRNSEQIRNLIHSIEPSHLLHMAWYAVPPDYRTSPQNIKWVSSSLDLIEAFRASGGTRAVFAGTCLEYDVRFGFCSEGVTPIRPTTLYGVCKNSLQEIVNHLAWVEDFNAAWGRIFFLYGPYEPRSRLVPSVVLSLLGGQTVRCTHGRQIRDFMHVSDVAEAFVALLDSDVRGTVNIASGTPIILKDLIYLVADTLGKRDRVELGALQAPIDEPALLVADIARLREEVGWYPKRALQDGILETIDWWQATL